MTKLKGKKALVTGGANGIGLAISKEFAENGATVFIADINEEAGAKAEKEVKGSKFVKLDVGNENAWIEAFKEIGEIDILVNNAGIVGNPEKMGPQDPENISVESWDIIHKINLTSVMLGCKHGIKNMKNRKNASIINMGSRSGKVGIPLNCAYASTKAAIINHSKSVALHCLKNGYNIRCNTVNPAAIMTDMWKMMLDGNEDLYQKLCSEIPMERFGTPEEVAKACLFLASEDSSYMTGTEINIDGGILAGTKTSPGEK